MSKFRIGESIIVNGPPNNLTIEEGERDHYYKNSTCKIMDVRDVGRGPLYRLSNDIKSNLWYKEEDLLSIPVSSTNYDIS